MKFRHLPVIKLNYLLTSVKVSHGFLQRATADGANKETLKYYANLAKLELESAIQYLRELQAEERLEEIFFSGGGK